MSDHDTFSASGASPQTNSREWWDSYFESEWEEHDGTGQTRHFMGLIVGNLPATELHYLREHRISVLDWGCAFGDGVVVLNGAFPNLEVTGLDFAERAIREASCRHPNCRFIHSPDGSILETFDVIITSNCLEHFEKPLDVIRSHIGMCRSLYIALVPYNEYPLHPHHRAQLREECFPEQLHCFIRFHTSVIDADPRWWPGQQLLVVYGSSQYVGDRHPTASNIAEKVVPETRAELGSHTLDEGRRRIADLEQKLKQLKIERDEVELILRRKLQEATHRFLAFHGDGSDQGAEVAALRRELEEIRQSVSWRLGNGMVRAVRAVAGARRTLRPR
jgi:polyhydroxyalkanoate synthesis regulator phasin